MITEQEINEANRKFDKLTDIVDELQKTYPPAINESIAISTSMQSKATGIIMELARWKGDLEPLVRHGYLLEKIRGLVTDYNAMAHDYKIVFGKAPFITKIETGIEEEHLTPKIVKRTNESVFRNIRLGKDMKLKRVV